MDVSMSFLFVFSPWFHGSRICYVDFVDVVFSWCFPRVPLLMCPAILDSEPDIAWKHIVWQAVCGANIPRHTQELLFGRWPPDIGWGRYDWDWWKGEQQGSDEKHENSYSILKNIIRFKKRTSKSKLAKDDLEKFCNICPVTVVSATS